jgi:uncharacterized protein YjbJ (UPF0337 family)
MTNDTIKGAARELKGKAQSAFGGATNDRSTQLKGEVNKVAGKAQKEFGKAKDAAE